MSDEHIFAKTDQCKDTIRPSCIWFLSMHVLVLSLTAFALSLSVLLLIANICHAYFVAYLLHFSTVLCSHFIICGKSQPGENYTF